MSWTLFKFTLKTNRFIIMLLTAIFCFYIGIILTLYDPNSVDTLNEMLKMMPEAMVKALNFQDFGTTLLTFITGYMYGFLIFLFPLTMVIIVNHRLIAAQVDKGSMAFLLATPTSRKKIAATQMVFSMATAAFLFIFATIATIIMCAIFFPGELEIGKFILVNIYAIIMYFAISGICFLGSAIANESKISLSIGAGLPVLFLVLQMLGDASDKLKWIGNLSLYALFDPGYIVNGDFFAFVAMGIYSLLAILFYGGAIYIFDKKNLYI